MFKSKLSPFLLFSAFHSKPVAHELETSKNGHVSQIGKSHFSDWLQRMRKIGNDEIVDDRNLDDDDTKGGTVEDKTITKQGFLMKKGQINTAYKRRYFILKNDTLFYFKDSEDMFHPQGVMYIAGSSIDPDPKDQKASYCFVLKASGGKDKTHVLQAESQEDKKSWISAILEKSKGQQSDKHDLELKDVQKQAKEESDKKISLEQTVKSLTNPLNSLIENLGKLQESACKSTNKRMPKDEDDPDYQLISRGKNLTDSISIFEITTKKMVFSTRKCVEVNNLIATQAQRKLEREILTKLEMGRIKECLGSIRVELEEIRNDFIDAMWQFSDLLAQMTPQSDESEATKELQELQNLEMEQQEEIKELTNHKRILLRELKSAREK
jgi:hypothetical protein